MVEEAAEELPCLSLVLVVRVLQEGRENAKRFLQYLRGLGTSWGRGIVCEM